MRSNVLRRVVVAAGAVAVLWVAAVPVATQEGGGGQVGGAELEKLRKMPTPRTADGKPDLSGWWGGGGGGGGGPQRFDAQGNYHNVRNDRKASPVNQERDAGLNQRFFHNLPVYKPEHWERVDYLDINGNVEDSNFHCFPAGVPRMGPPALIFQSRDYVAFLYQQKNTWRVIPTDGREHHPINSKDQTYMGDAVGRWEGDTLVIDVTGFNDETWLGWPGYFHSNEMRVIERVRREGNVLHYQVTVEDPDVLAEPWVMDPRVLRLNTNPYTQIEDPPCVETDGENMYTKERG
jgi:hypothetical protein